MKSVLKNIDKPLFIVTLLLITIGLINIFSAGNITAFMKYGASPYRYFIKQSVFIGASFVAALIILPFHSKSYSFFSTIGVMVVAGALVFVRLFGEISNNARSWLNFERFSIQPSEFAKIIAIIWLAGYYESHKDKLDRYLTALYPIAICVCLAILIFIQPDLGTTIIFSFIVAFMFFLSPVSKEIKGKMFFMLSCLLIIGAIAITSGVSILNERQLKRMEFSDPCSVENFYGDGNQLCNSYIAINNGGFRGTGLGKSMQKYLYLPEAHTDFIFPIIVEENGMIAAILLMVLYFALIGRIIKIAKDCYNSRGYLICMGVAIYILLHISVNLGGVMGLIPMTGVPLPFMSYGGSFAMCLILALTFVQRINYENMTFKEKKEENSKKSNRLVKKYK